MSGWFQESVLAAGKLRLFCFFVAFIVTFLFIRFSVRRKVDFPHPEGPIRAVILLTGMFRLRLNTACFGP